MGYGAPAECVGNPHTSPVDILMTTFPSEVIPPFKLRIGLVPGSMYRFAVSVCALTATGRIANAAGRVTDGPGGAHQVINRSDQVARVLFLSTTGLPANVGYPDSGMWLMRNTSDEDGVMVHPGPAQ